MCVCVCVLEREGAVKRRRPEATRVERVRNGLALTCNYQTPRYKFVRKTELTTQNEKFGRAVRAKTFRRFYENKFQSR